MPQARVLPTDRSRVGSPARAGHSSPQQEHPMRRLAPFARIVSLGSVLFLLVAPLAAQTDGFPTISGRQFTGGSAKVTVTGSTTITKEIPINTVASFSDGESTWLQFGASGAAEP